MPNKYLTISGNAKAEVEAIDVSAGAGDAGKIPALDAMGQIDPSMLPGAAVSISTTEIDFGTTPISEAEFTVTDATVSPASHIIGQVAYEAPTGKDIDELTMDAIDLKFQPGSGEFYIYAKGLEGYLADKFKINYLVG